IYGIVNMTRIEDTSLPIPGRTLRDFDILKVLAHGREGTRVYLARDRETSLEIALKVIPKLRLGPAGEDKRKMAFRHAEVLKEQIIHRGLSHFDHTAFILLLCSFHD